MKKNILFKGLASIASFLTMTLVGTSIGMFRNAGFINDFLKISTSKLVPKDGEDVETPIRFASDFSADINNFTAEEREKEQDAAALFAESEEEEGAVLLKNENNALPLTADDIKNVATFGRNSLDPMYKYQAGGGHASLGKHVTYLDALKDRGFKLNQKLLDAYSSDTSKKLDYDNISESPLSIYSDGVISSLDGSVAIIMISRTFGESHDAQPYYKDSDGSYISQLSLSKNEKDMLSLIKRLKNEGKIKKSVVLINSCNPIETSFLDDYDVDASLMIGGPGKGCGFNGVADLLIGDSNPSGRLVDTYATSSYSAPAFNNFGNIRDKTTSKSYAIYAENIYVGYKYYETRYEDCILNRFNASSDVGTYASTGSWSYKDEVRYPFGFGLSYTTFSQRLVSVTEKNPTTLDVKVTVKNEGNKAGKSVVEVYAQSPYEEYEKNNSVEKAAVQLAAFDKTKVLEPGQEETLTIPVEKYLLASYDSKSAKGYYLSQGDYYLSVGVDAHDALNNILAKKNAKGMYTHDGKSSLGNAENVYKFSSKFDDKTFRKSAAGVEVTNRFDDYDVNSYLDNKVTYLSRKDWKSTYPKTIDISFTAKMLEQHAVKYSKAENAISADSITTGKDGGLNFADMFGIEYNSPIWDTFMDQLSIDDMINCLLDNFGIGEIKSVNFPGEISHDGSDGLDNGNGYVTESVAAACWNKELIEKRGDFIAEDALFAKENMLFGPGANFHRTVFAGRNAEYYSEDSTLGYYLSEAETVGMKKKGLVVGIKHFVTNDQETNRGSIATYMNEQTLRELMLRPFQGALERGKANGLMMSNSSLGNRWMGSCKELLIDVLRGEWDFKGIVITDAVSNTSDERTVEGVVCGTNQYCFGKGKERARDIKTAIVSKDDGDLLKIVRERSKEVLYTFANSNLMNGLSSSFYVVSITPWWESALIAIDVAFGVVTLGCVALSVVFSRKKKGE